MSCRQSKAIQEHSEGIALTWKQEVRLSQDSNHRLRLQLLCPAHGAAQGRVLQDCETGKESGRKAGESGRKGVERDRRDRDRV